MTSLGPGADGEHVTFCRICEPFCGMIATVKNGRVTALAPDHDNPHSQGHVCIKGVNFHHVTHDPDRVMYPLKRIGGPGEFVRVSWDEALDDIAGRLTRIIDQHGSDAVASYKGNPIAFSAEAQAGVQAFLKALNISKYYGVGPQDTSARFAANYFLWGSALTLEIPDTHNCDFLLVFGGNPLVSNGSMMFAPRIRQDLDEVAKRGEVVVIDPRKTETAQRYTHIPVRPSEDIWMILAMLHEIVRSGKANDAFLSEHTSGWSELKKQILSIDVAHAAERSGVPAVTINALAHRLADTPRAAAYGRIGLCRGPFATLTNVLLSALNIVCGKFGRPGGVVFSRPLLAGSETGVLGGYGEVRTRIGDFPSVARFLASAVMPADILEPGPGQVRALICTGGNPILAAPGGPTLERALQSLECMVSLDFYQNETHQYAHYILPTPTFLERRDVPAAALLSINRPFFQYTDAVIPPVGEARPEFDIFADLLVRMGRRMPDEFYGESGELRHPLEMLDIALRTGPVGDHFGEREGWSFERLREFPHGAMLELPSPYEQWSRIAHWDRKLHLWNEHMAEEFVRLFADAADDHGLRLVTRRDVRSINSWMHNVERLSRSQHPTLLISHQDAADRRLATGDAARLSSAHSAVIITIEVSDEVSAGTVCYPHGWGHSAGWTTARQKSGANINLLLGIGPDIVEKVSGTTIMDGLPVHLEKVA